MLTRRQIMKVAAGGLALGAFPRGLRALVQDVPPPPYGGFKVGIQAFTFRKNTLDEFLAKVKELEVPYAEIMDGVSKFKVTTDPAEVAALKEKFRASGVTPISLFAGLIKKKKENTRVFFEFAKLFDIPVIVGDPNPDALDSLGELTEEFGIKFGIHNHGPMHRYGTLEQMLAALKDRPATMGMCLDTGHTIRINENPGEAIRKLGARVHGIHLKDSLDAKHDTILGEGKVDLPDVLKALKEIGFSGLLGVEYEIDPVDPMDELRQSLKFLRETIAKL